MKKFWFQVNEENIITDAIEYEYPGYLEVELNDEFLPAGINGGWHVWHKETNQYIFIQELYDAAHQEQEEDI